MTLVFSIEHPERCQYCHKPVRDYIYQHQCRPKTQPMSCLSCLSEKGSCRYCYSPFTVLKLANDSWINQRYYEKPARRTHFVPFIRRSVNPDLDEVLREYPDSAIPSLDAHAQAHTQALPVWEKTLPSSDFRGYIIDGEDDEEEDYDSDEEDEKLLDYVKSLFLLSRGDAEKGEDIEREDEEDELVFNATRVLVSPQPKNIIQTEDIPMIDLGKRNKVF